jgi:hypothetical protein
LSRYSYKTVTGNWVISNWVDSKRANRLQQTADSEGRGLREGFKEKWKGDSPSPLVPFDRLTTPLSLGGARKTKEKGYDGP